MLVLTRKVDDKIVIGNNHEITAKILRISGGKVRIGIEAPPEIRIQREEILRKHLTHAPLIFEVEHAS